MDRTSRDDPAGGPTPAQSLMTIPAEWTGESELLDEILLRREVRIERIVSKGHVTPPGEWYDQSQEEWVALLQGEARLLFADGSACDLRGGDSLLIAAHRRHRLEFTSVDPPCIWLAVHLLAASQAL